MKPLPSPAVTDPVLLDFCAEVGEAGPVAVAGAKTRWTAGGGLSEGARLVTAPTGIVSYNPAEMTVRVRAGTTVEELNQTLAAEGQLSALPDRGGTVGGALAVGENDLRMLGRGRVRDSLLQVRYVSADGVMVSGGGNTVKNVSGFDLPKLMVGSLGTLGFIAEALLRTNPAPEVQKVVSSTDAEVAKVLDTVLAPNLVLWDGTTTWVELAGNPAAVAAQIESLAAIGSFVSADQLPSLPPYRWSLAPSEIYRCAEQTGAFVASIGVGTVWATNPQPKMPLSTGVQLMHDRMKAQFDPTGRLNPGRKPGA